MPPTILPADEHAIALATRRLIDGAIVALPTETVYGLAARADQPEAIQRIYTAKQRPATNPLIVHVHTIEHARALTAAWPDVADRLARRFWPGPLTVVLPRGSALAPAVSAGRPTIALRIPRHPVLTSILQACALPLAAPSANRSNALSPVRAEHVARSLGDVDDLLILDAGPCTVGLESTVIDLTNTPPRLLRHGPIRPEDLHALIPDLITAKEHIPDHLHRPSPGLSPRHYAPSAELHIFDVTELSLALQAAELAHRQGQRTALLIAGPIPEQLPAGTQLTCLPLGHTPAHAQARLYDLLHIADQQADWIGVIRPALHPDWAAINDRLERAAHPAPSPGKKSTKGGIL